MSLSTSNLLTFLHGLYQLQSVNALSEYICTALPGLIGGENAMLCRHDGKQKIITSVVARHPFSCANLIPHINESGIMAQHPFWESVFDESQPARALSDLVSRKTWHANPLYREVFSPDGIEDQLNMEILGDPETFTSLNVLRGRRGFAREEVDVFVQLRPHFAQAFQHAAIAERAGYVDEDHQKWMVSVCVDGSLGRDRPVAVSGVVEAWVMDRVRDLNRGWLETRIAPLVLRDGDTTWTYVLYRNPHGEGYWLSVMKDHQQSRAARLSPRELEVMDWVAAGKTNEEIAIILGLTINTVKTHLKRSFFKLGVENRTAAVAWWHQRARACHPKG